MALGIRDLPLQFWLQLNYRPSTIAESPILCSLSENLSFEYLLKVPLSGRVTGLGTKLLEQLPRQVHQIFLSTSELCPNSVARETVL